MIEEIPTKNGNGSRLLSHLLKSDNASKILGLLIVIMGGGNFWQTREAENASRAEFERAFREIHDIHSILDSTIARQKYLEAALRRIEDKLQTSENK